MADRRSGPPSEQEDEHVDLRGLGRSAVGALLAGVLVAEGPPHVTEVMYRELTVE